MEIKMDQVAFELRRLIADRQISTNPARIAMLDSEIAIRQQKMNTAYPKGWSLKGDSCFVA